MPTADQDRRIEALAAERVLGWERVEHQKLDGEPPPGFEERMHTGPGWYKDGRRMACEECGDLPQYLSSIADAFALLEAHGDWRYDLGREWIICNFGTPKVTHSAYILIVGDERWNLIGSGFDEASMPRAITYAALRAVDAGPELDALLKGATDAD
jgi:hypothetical protein